MANYTFPADGVLKPDAIKFYPRDAAGNFVSDVQLSITAGCGSLSNRRETTDDQGNQCLVYDYTPPSNNTGNACVVQASINGSTCTCPITLTGDQKIIDCSGIVLSSNPASPVIGESVTFSFSLLDSNGNPVDGPSVSNTGLSNVTLNDLGNGNWSYSGTVTSESGTISIFSDCGDCEGIAFSATTKKTVDCDNIFCQPNSYAIDEDGAISIFVPDTEGNAITSGINFEFDGATVSSLPTYNADNGRWEFNITPTQESFSASLTFDDQVCSDFCSFSASAIAVACNSIVCDVGNFTVGQTGTQQVTILNSDGDPITAGVTFVLQGGDLESSPSYNAATGKWSFDFMPKGTETVLSVLTGIGNCQNACVIEAEELVNPTINCSAVQCLEPSNGFVIGEEAEIQVFVPDSNGDPVTSGVTFDFTGATLNSTPLYVASTSNWVFNIIPNGTQIVGSILTSSLGNCNNFCSLTARPDGNVECCPEITSIDLSPMVVGSVFNGSVSFDDADVVASFLDLPDGIIADGNNLSGVPTQAGVSTFRIVTAGNCSTSVTVVVASNEGNGGNSPCPKLETVSLPTGIIGDPYSGFAVFSGTGSRTYQALGLPPGLNVNNATGQITGTPNQIGNYNIDYSVTDSTGTCNYRLTIDVDDQSDECPQDCPRLTSVPSLFAYEGEGVNLSLSATAENNANVVFVSSAIGSGLTINSSGVITGTPEAAGLYPFNIEMSANGRSCISQHFFKVEKKTQESSDPCNSILMTVCSGSFDLDMQDNGWTLDSALPSGLNFDMGKFSGEITEGVHSVRLKKDELMFSFVLCARECCGHSKGDASYWVQMIACETVNGVTYNNSLQCPSDPITVTKEQRDHLIMNGLAVACV